MKRLSVLLVLLIFLLYGCIKTDTNTYNESTHPVIILNGDNPMTVTLNEMFVDPGVTVKGGFKLHRGVSDSIEVIHNIPINGPENGNGITNTVGIYKVTYSVPDGIRNNKTVDKDRTVIVINNSAKYAGDYLFDKTGGESIFPNFNDMPTTIEFDYHVNNRIIFNKISNKTGFRVFASIAGDTAINIPDQYFVFPDTITDILYRIRGEPGQSHVIDNILLTLSIKYQLEKYVETTSFDYDYEVENRYWKSVAYSINVEFYEKY